MKAAALVPLAVVLSRQPLMYIPMGMREPIVIAVVVFALLKPSSLVMLGTIFLYMREGSSKGTANPTSVAKLSGFIHVATKVPMGSKTFAKAMLSIRRAAKLEDTTMTTALSI